MLVKQIKVIVDTKPFATMEKANEILREIPADRVLSVEFKPHSSSVRGHDMHIVIITVLEEFEQCLKKQ